APHRTGGEARLRRPAVAPADARAPPLGPGEERAAEAAPAERRTHPAFDLVRPDPVPGPDVVRRCRDERSLDLREQDVAAWIELDDVLVVGPELVDGRQPVDVVLEVGLAGEVDQARVVAGGIGRTEGE